MAFAQDETVSIGPQGIGGIVSHDVFPEACFGVIGSSEVENRQEVGDRKRPARVSHPRLCDVLNGVFSNLGSKQLQTINLSYTIQELSL